MTYSFIHSVSSTGSTSTRSRARHTARQCRRVVSITARPPIQSSRIWTGPLAQSGRSLSRRRRRTDMRDPHVEALHYKIGSVETISYDDPKPMTFSNHLGEFSLLNGKLRIAPVEHFA